MDEREAVWGLWSLSLVASMVGAFIFMLVHRCLERRLTLRHLLDHFSGYPFADTANPAEAWADYIESRFDVFSDAFEGSRHLRAFFYLHLPIIVIAAYRFEEYRTYSIWVLSFLLAPSVVVRVLRLNILPPVPDIPRLEAITFAACLSASTLVAFYPDLTYVLEIKLAWMSMLWVAMWDAGATDLMSLYLMGVLFILSLWVTF
ncbi:hypothetical protein GGS20DRAFT_396972 [Poronia punctata]|nr:hypothetical protein GGS20DRAFT_396972 [Poronia punctata]